MLLNATAAPLRAADETSGLGLEEPLRWLGRGLIARRTTLELGFGRGGRPWMLMLLLMREAQS